MVHERFPVTSVLALVGRIAMVSMVEEVNQPVPLVMISN